MFAEIFILATALFSILFGLYLVVLIIYFSSCFFVWPPSVPSNRKSRKVILEMISKYHIGDEKIKIADMGSGYGHLVFAIARKFKKADVTGVELLWLPFLFSKLVSQIFKNVKILKGDIYQHDFSQYDVFVFFFRKDHGFDEKLREGIKKRTVVISSTFPLKTFEPVETINLKYLVGSRNVYCYVIGE